MNEIDEILTVRVKRSKTKVFRDMLKRLDFVKLETPEEKLERFLCTAPKDVPLSDDYIMNIIKGDNT